MDTLSVNACKVIAVTQTAAGSARKQNPRGRGGLLRAEIVAAAFDLLDAGGTTDVVTLRAVARAAGITAPAIYPHFASRDELMAAMRDTVFERVLAATAYVEGADPVDALLASCKSYVDFGMARPASQRLMFTPIPGASGERGEATVRSLVDALDLCVRAGRSASTDTQADASHLIATLHGVAMARASLPQFPWPPLADAVHDIVVRLARL